jgi:hypothetical protein
MVEPAVLRSLAREEPGAWRVVEGRNGSFRLDAATRLRVRTLDGSFSAYGHELRLSEQELVLGDHSVRWTEVRKIEVTNPKPAWFASVAALGPHIATAAVSELAEHTTEHVEAEIDTRPTSEGTPHYVLNGWERRRGTFGIHAAGEVGSALRGKEGFLQGGALMLRVYGIVDVGGGYRHVFASRNGGEIVSRHLGFARLGTHLAFDEGRYFAIGVFLDAGAGTETAVYTRIGWGIRVRVFDEIHLALYPLNPVFTKFPRERVNEGPRVEWRVPSSLELSFVF